MKESWDELKIIVRREFYNLRRNCFALRKVSMARMANWPGEHRGEKHNKTQKIEESTRQLSVLCAFQGIHNTVQSKPLTLIFAIFANLDIP